MHAVLEKPLGILIFGDAFKEIIPSGTRLPHRYSETFTTSVDGQAAIEITLAQIDSLGIEKIMSAGIGELPWKPRGTIPIHVTVTVDQNKQMTVKATVSETGQVRESPPIAVV